MPTSKPANDDYEFFTEIGRILLAEAAVNIRKRSFRKAIALIRAAHDLVQEINRDQSTPANSQPQPDKESADVP